MAKKKKTQYKNKNKKLQNKIKQNRHEQIHLTKKENACSISEVLPGLLLDELCREKLASFHSLSSTTILREFYVGNREDIIF